MILTEVMNSAGDYTPDSVVSRHLSLRKA